MKSSTPFATTIAAIHFAFASGQAFSPVSTPTATGASSTASSSALGGLCPEYDGQNFTDGNSVTYTVHCDAYATSENEYLVTNPSTVATAAKCMDACDEFDGCEGAVYYPGSRCVLTIGTTFGWQQNSSGVAYFIMQGVPATVSSSASISSSMTPSISSATISLMSSAPPVPDSAVSCNASDIQCPACDGETVTDNNGTAYTVYCDYKLNASSYYDVQAYTSASGCLLHCDDYTWCMGATFWQGGNCQLAKGNVSPLQDTGYTAFVPVTGANKTASSYSTIATSTSAALKGVTSIKPSMTAVSSNSGATFIPDGPQSTSYASPPATSALAATPITSTVPTNATLSASCPGSDGTNVADVVNQTYRVACDYEPICETNVNGTKAYYSQETCLESCDQDALCLAATWSLGNCTLCEGSIQGLTFYEAGSGTVVFLSPEVAEELDQPVSANGASSAGTAPPTSSPSLLQPSPDGTEGSVSSAAASSSSLVSMSPISKVYTAPGIYVPPSSSAATTISTAPVPISTTLSTFITAVASSISTIPASFSFSAVSSSSVTPSLDAYYGSATTIPTTSSVQQEQTFITAPAPSSTSAGYAPMTISDLSSEYPATGTSTSSSSSFVPPLNSGSVSYASPGGQTRVVGTATLISGRRNV